MSRASSNTAVQLQVDSGRLHATGIQICDLSNDMTIFRRPSSQLPIQWSKLTCQLVHRLSSKKHSLVLSYIQYPVQSAKRFALLQLIVSKYDCANWSQALLRAQTREHPLLAEARKPFALELQLLMSEACSMPLRKAWTLAYQMHED